MKDPAKGCGIDCGPTEQGDQHTRQWVRIARVECGGTFLPFAHHDCSCNQTIALRNRVLGAVPEPTALGLNMLRKQARRLGYLLPRVSPDDWYVMPDMYSGGKRQRYVQATDRVLATGLTPKSAKVKLFVKFEKLSPAKVNPDPRAIQFRDAKYCVALARYLKPCEHPLYQMKGDGRYFPATRFIGKGLSQASRAQLLVEKMAAFSAPVVVSLDASRFDQHVSKELLEIEHSVYLRMCPDPEFARLLSWQLHNKGVSTKGIRYHTRGKRMSGDMNTALGNCVLMTLMVSAFMAGRKYDMLDDGDDCLLIIEEEEYEWVCQNAGRVFLDFGMEIKVENVSRTIEGVEWCQSSPIQYEPGKYKFVRNPWKVLSTAMGGVKYIDSSTARRKLLNTIGMAEMVLNLGVPVLQSFAEAMMRNAATTKHIELQECDPMYYRVARELQAMNLRQLVRLSPQPISDTARESFTRAFGITADEQMELERFFSSWSFTLDGAVPSGPDYDVMTWQRNSFSTLEAWPLRE
jgi:hypothetical protein